MVETFLKTYFQNRPLFLGLIRAKELELFRRFLPPAVASFASRILDFGSGDGFFTETLFNKVRFLLTGSDLDEKVLRKTRTNGIYSLVTCCDGALLPFRTNTFDLIVANSVLEHVDDLQHTIRELHRVLKKRGTLLCSVMTERWETHLLGRCFLGKSYSAWMRRRQDHKHLLCCEEWRSHFEREGLKTRKVIGYLDTRASRWFELLHYLSAPALISYKLCGTWILFPSFFDVFPVHVLFSHLVRNDIPPGDAAALFFALDKVT